MVISKEGIFNELNAIVGPADPFVARKTSPYSIRALFGKDIVRNCVYWAKSRRHYRKVFSFFFFEQKENLLLYPADSDSHHQLSNGHINHDVYHNNDDIETATSITSGMHSNQYYNSCAPCAIVIIKPSAMIHIHDIENIFKAHDAVILSKRTTIIHPHAVYGFLKLQKTFETMNQQIMDLIVKDMCSGQACVYSLGDKRNSSFNHVERGLARIHEISKLISTKFGHNQIQNAIYVSSDIDEMRKENFSF